jgi:Ca-activated chloride channel family protein
MRFKILGLTLLAAGPLFAAETCVEDAMIVFDGSGSMAEAGFNLLDEPRIYEARRALEVAMPPIASQRRLGMVVYGPGGTDECNGINLAFAPRADAAPSVIATANQVQPEGATALTEGVALAARVLEYQTKPGIVVLVTDGKETCGGTPCMLAAELMATAVDLTIHVIGFKVRGEHFSWGETKSHYTDAETASRCMADDTGGLYVPAETVEELVAAFHATLGCLNVSMRWDGPGLNDMRG